jgi:hypothetical protein
VHKAKIQAAEYLADKAEMGFILPITRPAIVTSAPLRVCDMSRQCLMHGGFQTASATAHRWMLQSLHRFYLERMLDAHVMMKALWLT